MDEQKENEFQDEFEEESGLKNWLQDNIRIILAVLIVVAIAAGIYSYSNRAGEEMAADDEITAEEDANESEEGDEDSVVVIDEETGEEMIAEVETETAEAQEQPTVAEQGKGGQVQESVETSEAFVQTASRGDSLTTLARRSLQDYLAQNNDPSLTAEHKVYIEDYLRKHNSYRGRVVVGQKVSFSKSLIKQAVDSSKNLSEYQLSNLKKYSARVGSF